MNSYQGVLVSSLGNILKYGTERNEVDVLSRVNQYGVDNLYWVCEGDQIEPYTREELENEINNGELSFVLSMETFSRVNPKANLSDNLPRLFSFNDLRESYWLDLRSNGIREWKKPKISGKCRILTEVRLLLELKYLCKEGVINREVSTFDMHDILNSWGSFNKKDVDHISYVTSLRKNTTKFFPGRKTFFKTSTSGGYISFNPATKFAIHEIRKKH